MNTFLLLAMTLSKKDIGYNSDITDGEGALADIMTMVYTWAGIIGVLIIVIAGLLFVTARGDAAQMKRAKDALRGAVIGLIVVMVAFAITRFVIGGIQQ